MHNVLKENTSMFRFIFTAFSSLFFVSGDNLEPERFNRIEKTFPLLWKTEIGNASFRTNALFTNNEILIGSNGKDFIDYTLGDNSSGVYKLNRMTGKITGHYGNDDVFGDMDVNGLLAYNNRYYFGNDNDEFICMDISGRILWSNFTSGDIEHEPVLININKQPAIVYASETGEVRAVKPEDGKTIWEYYTPDFKGWKPGENRAVFKVKSFFKNTTNFFTKPVITDLNKDGVNDLLYMTYPKEIYAINGKNGQLLWKKDNKEDKIEVFELLSKPQGEWIIVAAGGTYQDNYKYKGHICLMNKKGEIRKITDLPEQSGPFGLNISFAGSDEILLTSHDKLFRLKNLKDIEIIDRQILYEREYSWTTEKIHERNSNDALIADKIFKYKNHNQCILILNQYDRAFSDFGYVEIVSLDQNKVIERLELDGNSEMQPIIADTNKDGMLDLLINCRYNGGLFCYNLNIPVSASSN
jgi:outer membrane protein assembly factor BamB